MEKLKLVVNVFVGVSCFLVGGILLLMEFNVAVVNNLEFLLPLFSFIKTSSVVVNTLFLALLSLYGVVCIAKAVVTFKITLLKNKSQTLA